MRFQVNRVSRNVFDIFEGNQWSDWSRLKAGKNGVFVAQGRSLPYSVVRQIAAAINPTLDKQEVCL